MNQLKTPATAPRPMIEGSERPIRRAASRPQDLCRRSVPQDDFSPASLLNATRFKFVGDMATLAGGQVVSKLLGFLAFAYLARTMGTATYGSIEYAASLAIFGSMIIDCGLGAVGVRELGKSPGRLAELAALIPALELMIALAVLPLVAMAALAAGQTWDTVILTWMFGLSLLPVPWKQSWLAQGLRKMGVVAIADVLQMLVLYAAVRLWVASREDLLWVGAAQILSMGAVSGFYLAYQHWCITPVRLNVSIQSMRELFMEAWSIGLSNMVWAFHQYSPVMLTIAIAGAEATGLFGAAHRLVVSLLTFSYVYHFSLFPEMARRAGRSPEALGTLLRASFRLVAWLGCGFALLLSIGARPMMSGLYGESFAGAATALAVLAWILPITILGGHARWSLITLGFQRCVLVSQLAGVATMLATGPLLIWRFGPVGASTSMVLACLAVWLVAHGFARRYVGHAPSLWIAVPPVGLALGLLLASEQLDFPWTWRLGGAALGFAVAALCLDRKLIGSLKFLNGSQQVDRDEA